MIKRIFITNKKNFLFSFFFSPHLEKKVALKAPFSVLKTSCSYHKGYFMSGYRFWKCFHFEIHLSIVQDKQALWYSMFFSSVMIVRSFSLFQFFGLSIWISSCIIFVFTMVVPGLSHVWKISSYLFTRSWQWEICVIKLLKRFHMFLTCEHSQIRYLDVSTIPHLGRIWSKCL